MLTSVLQTMSRLTLSLFGVLFTVSCYSADAMEITDGKAKVSVDDVRLDMSGFPADLRMKMSKDQVIRYVSNMLTDIRLAEAATQAGLSARADVQAKLRKASRDVLARAYVDERMSIEEKNLPELSGLARERYETNKATYVIPEAVRVAHILIKTTTESDEAKNEQSKAKALAVLAELKQGKDFSELAKKISEDIGSAPQGGEVQGWAPKGRFVPEFEQASFSMRAGEVSELVKTKFGYHIIKLLDKRETRNQSFEEVQAQLMAQLKKELLADKKADLVRRFSPSEPIQISNVQLDLIRK